MSRKVTERNKFHAAAVMPAYLWIPMRSVNSAVPGPSWDSNSFVKIFILRIVRPSKNQWYVWWRIEDSAFFRRENCLPDQACTGEPNHNLGAIAWLGIRDTWRNNL